MCPLTGRPCGLLGRGQRLVTGATGTRSHRCPFVQTRPGCVRSSRRHLDRVDAAVEDLADGLELLGWSQGLGVERQLDDLP
jgi:tetrahydromethanopterin S-methyltransferase subunit F